uniref:RRM domain-containing protein n=1 Tax=Timema poppense TaxID=170557 RepID=A0A7R9CZU9_TIMPO|nr:unnamed protein product [Timema poppensis]
MSGIGEYEDVIKLRGLPWSASIDEILKFFGECKIKDGKLGIHMTMSAEGRPSGEAYVEFDSEEDIENALKKDLQRMGHRYIEVFKVKRSEMEWDVNRSGTTGQTMDDACVKLRGIPFGCSKDDIIEFFSGLEIVPNGISLPTDFSGRSTGEAYVQFISKEVAEKALLKHKEKNRTQVGSKGVRGYIEIFRSSLMEVRAALSPKMRTGAGGYNQRPTPYDRGDRFGAGGGGGGGGPMNRFGNVGRPPRTFKGGFGDFGEMPSPWSNPAPWDGRNSNRVGGGGGGWNSNGAGPSGGFCVHMRGLPFRATEQDIADCATQFFRPLVPLNINLLMDNTGRRSGEADVEFSSHEDATKAMEKNKTNMEHRYIELFLNSSPARGGGRGNFGGFGGTGLGGGFSGGLGNGFQRNFSGPNMGGGYNSNFSF